MNVNILIETLYMYVCLHNNSPLKNSTFFEAIRNISYNDSEWRRIDSMCVYAFFFQIHFLQ